MFAYSLGWIDQSPPSLSKNRSIVRCSSDRGLVLKVLTLQAHHDETFRLSPVCPKHPPPILDAILSLRDRDSELDLVCLLVLFDSFPLLSVRTGGSAGGPSIIYQPFFAIL